MDPDTQRGLYNKYTVTKNNGNPVGQCFVLEEHDRFAPRALLAYALACEEHYPLLAADLRELANRWNQEQQELKEASPDGY